MVLDWKENESLWVGAEEWLIHLLWLNAWCYQRHIDLLLLDLGLGFGGDVLEGDIGGGWHVLLSDTKVELLHRRLKLGGGSLQEEYISTRFLDAGWVLLTLLDGVTGAIA